jgi:long-chain acyl-CoA synthetase
VIPGGVSHSLHLYGAVHGLHRGTPVILLPRFDPRTVLEELQLEEGRAALYATPTQLQLIAGAARRKGPLKCVPVVFCSGAKWPDGARAAVAGVFPAAHLVEFYGASETSFISFRRSGEDTPPGSVGRLADGVRVAIGDPQERLPAGMAGPVWVKSRLLFSGYICGHAPETVWRDGWLTFGDHGYLDGGGNLFLCGRQNRMVITSGLNVYPEEIETVLMTHPAVSVAAVVGVGDLLRGERLEAVVELKSGLEDAERTLGRYCRDRIGGGKTPRRFHVRAGLPLTAGGKPDLQLIRAELDKADQKRVLEKQNQ